MASHHLVVILSNGHFTGVDGIGPVKTDVGMREGDC